MKSLYLAIIIILIALVVYQFVTRKPPVYQVGPTQEQLEVFKQKKAKTTDSLLTRLQAIRRDFEKDSARYHRELVNSNVSVHFWKRKASEAKDNLSDVPDSIIVPKLTKIITLQDSVIEHQDRRIHTDSLYVKSLQTNFDRRLAIEQWGRKLLEEENKLQAGVIQNQKDEIRKRKKAQIIEGAVIVGLFILLL